MPVVDFDPEKDELSEDKIKAEAPQYETMPLPDEWNRQAVPPDGIDQSWRDLHPNGAKFLDNYENKEGTGE